MYHRWTLLVYYVTKCYLKSYIAVLRKQLLAAKYTDLLHLLPMIYNIYGQSLHHMWEKLVYGGFGFVLYHCVTLLCNKVLFLKYNFVNVLTAEIFIYVLFVTINPFTLVLTKYVRVCKHFVLHTCSLICINVTYFSPMQIRERNFTSICA